MDPLSISASIVALLQVSGVIIDIIATISSASKEIRLLTSEINATRALLSSIADIAGVDEEWNQNLQKMAGQNGPLEMLELLLTKLEYRLSREARVENGLAKLTKKLSWPWRLEETREMLSIARTARGLLAEALVMDHLTVTKQIRQDTKEIHQSLQTSVLKHQVTEQGKIIEWLSSVNITESQSAARAKHEPGTGGWLINSKQFDLWISGSAELMWLHGIPGSGKTVLCSTIVEHTKKFCENSSKLNTFCVYYYFDFKDRKRQTSDGFVRSALAQLCQQTEMIPGKIKELYDERSTKGQEPTSTKFIETFMILLDCLGKTYIILDALDECEEQDEMVDIISKVKESCGMSASVFVTSRMERPIQARLEPLVTQTIALQGPEVSRDIQALVHGVLQSDPILSKRPPSMRKEIEQVLVDGSNGMFRWVVCQLDALRSCLTPSAVRKTLHSLPRTLDETYERILCAVDEEVRPIAHTALQCLAISSRPVNLEELSEMVAIKPGVSIFDEIDRLFDPKDLFSVCSSLITESASTSSIQLSHFSVREFLVSERILNGPASFFAIKETEAHLAMAERCLTYLLSFDKPLFDNYNLYPSAPYEVTYSSDMEELPNVDHPLLRYAAFEWYNHVRVLPDEYQDQIEPMILRLLNPDDWPWNNWTSYSREDISISSNSPFYYAAMLGLLFTVRSLLKLGADVNAIGGTYGSALSVACNRGYHEVVRMLLDHGADVNIIGGLFHTPLQTCCAELQATIFQILLDHGADINIVGGYYGCALQAACARGWPEAALRLIKMGANINIVAGQFGTALQAASRYGRTEVIEELLARGANVNATGGYYHTALQAAARGGHVTVVQLLLDHGADATIQGGFCGNALEAAYSRNNLAVADILKAKLSVDSSESHAE